MWVGIETHQEWLCHQCSFSATVGAGTAAWECRRAHHADVFPSSFIPPVECLKLFLKKNPPPYNRYSSGLARCLKHVDLMNVKCILCMIDSICQKHLESQAMSTIFHSNINKIQSIRFYYNTFLCKPKFNHKCNHSFFLIVIYFILIALGWPYVTISLTYVLFVSSHFSPQWRRFAGSQLGWKHALRPVWRRPDTGHHWDGHGQQR